MDNYITVNSRRKKYIFDYTFFHSIDTEEKAYWLGFLYADGYVNYNTVEICINRKDYDHLIKFRNALGANSILIKAKNEVNAYRFSIYSVELAYDLMAHGCYQNKSLTLQFPNEDMVPYNLIHHFMRGYFDGDGCVYVDKLMNGKFELVGTIEFINKYEEILISHCSKKTLTKHDRQHSWDPNLTRIRYGGNKRFLDIYNFLYKNANVFLDRKKEKFDIVISRLILKSPKV